MKAKHDFPRRAVRLCLIMMIMLTLTVICMAFVCKETIEAGALGVLMGGWCGELLLTLPKRKLEMDDKANAQAENLEESSKEEGAAIWNSGM